jgi:hypothetical protein
VSGGSICADATALRSTASCGTTLANTWTDAINDNNGEGVTLLGRIGSKLAKLSGNGFIQIISGKAFLVSSVRLKLTTLWHEWYKPAGINRRPVLGVPFAAPYQVIADSDGVIHAIKGRTGEGVTTDSIHIWNLELGQWDTREVADFPLLQRGLSPTATGIELTGFAPIATSGSSNDVRTLSRLAGLGVVYLEQQPTIASSCECDGCEPIAAVASVAKLLPFPTTAATEYVLKFNTVGGPFWEEV